MDEEEYLNGFSYAMMGVCYAWCQGASFSQVCKMTSIFEGSLIRSVRRLEELLRQLVSAAKAIGNGALETKFAECKLVYLCNLMSITKVLNDRHYQD
jgi:ATP-dependent RNA helicase DOB1